MAGATTPELDPALRRCLKSEECVAFIGSGPSMSQYGSWRDLINHVCKQCGVVHQVDEQSSADDLLDAAEEAKRANEDGYYKAIGLFLGRIPSTNPLYDVLMRIPFRAYVTVNLDPLLAFEARKPRGTLNTDILDPSRAAQSPEPEYPHKVEVYPSLRAASINAGTIFFLHGLVEEDSVPGRGSIVLSRSEFDKAYGPSGMLNSFLHQLLTFHPICFIGCRLDEPPFVEVFKRCAASQEHILAQHGGSRPERYILLAEEHVLAVAADGTPMLSGQDASVNRKEAEDRHYRDKGITVLRYDRMDESHRGLRLMFEKESNLRRRPPMRLGLSTGVNP